MESCFASGFDGDPNGLHSNVHGFVCLCDGLVDDLETKGYTLCCAYRCDYR